MEHRARGGGASELPREGHGLPRGDGRAWPIRQAVPRLRLARAANRVRRERIELLRDLPDGRETSGRSRAVTALEGGLAEDARGAGGEEGKRPRLNLRYITGGLEPSIQDRLAAHRLLVGAPPDQLAWLAARGRLVQLETGHVLTAKSGSVLGL